MPRDCPRRGALVWLHGVADNHESGAGLVDRFGRRGFDVVAYDCRANGESAGDAAFGRAETDGHFSIDAVSPVRAAARIRVPVLLIHGDADVDTRPEHSRRIFEALQGPKRLILVPGATHNRSLRSEVWADIDRWIDQVIASPGTLAH